MGDRHGEKRSKHRIRAQNIQFLRRPSSGEDSPDRGEDEGVRERSTPDWSSGGHVFNVGDSQKEPPDEASDEPPVDDIPF